jgi:putative exosortase-associated protein (TIGR04073 family)
MKRWLCTLTLGLSLAALVPAANAYEDGRYTPLDKLGRGLAGMTTGFLELPGNIVAENRDRGPAHAATIGVAKGIGMIPVRELVGVFDVVTAPIEVPEHYDPVLHPEYPWGYFEGSPSASLDRHAER